MTFFAFRGFCKCDQHFILPGMQGVLCVGTDPVLWVGGVQCFFPHFLFWEHRAADKALSSLLGRSLMSAAFCSIKYLSKWTSSLQFSRGSQVVSPSSHLTLNQMESWAHACPSILQTCASQSGSSPKS